MIRSFAAAFAFSMCLTQAWAGALLYPSVFYKSSSVDVNGSAQIRADTFVDLRGGYMFAETWFVGAMYSLTTGVGDNGYSQLQSAGGPTIGYYGGHWIATLSYFPFATYDVKNATNQLQHKNGSGLQVDASYLLPLTEKVQAGPAFTFRQITYQTRNVNGSGEHDWTYKMQDFFPYIGVVFLF